MRRLSLFLAILFFSSVCSAEMTIYFKDGHSRKVHRIEFQGDTADLYLTDGSTESVEVSKIDLETSGIAVPRGTYGSKVLGKSTRANPTSTTMSRSEQDRLEEQWKSSSKEYEARIAYQSIAAGDIVHLINSTGYTVTVIHRESSGNYKKFLIDRSSFADHFQKPPKVTPSAPPVTAKEVVTPVAPQPEPAPTIKIAPETKTVLPEEVSKREEPVAKHRTGGTNWKYLILGLALLLGVGGGAFLLSRNGNTMTIDPSKIHLRESDLRDRRLRLWLEEGRTNRQLVELCLNHFFSDRPKILGASLRILDGDPKSLVVASFMRTNRMNPGQAEILYEQVENVIEMSRSLIDDVSRSTGLWPSDRQLQSMSGDPRVARAALFPRAFSAAPSDRVVIVQRPYIISVSAVLLFLSATLTLIFAFGGFPGSDMLKETMGTVGLVLGIAFTFACAYGYWTMRRWAVLLYALEVGLRLWADFPVGLIVVPLFIVVFGMTYFSDMTWK